MNYILKPSLQHLAVVKVVTLLWNQQDIRALLTDVPLPILNYNSERWLDIEKSIVKKVEKFEVSVVLKERIINTVKPIGLQIASWMNYHSRDYFRISLPSKLIWTQHGTVDVRSTAKLIIKDESLDIIPRYKLACVYCLEDEISQLFDQIPYDVMFSFFHPSPLHFGPDHLVFSWTIIMEKKARLEPPETRPSTDISLEEKQRPFNNLIVQCLARMNLTTTLENFISISRPEKEFFIKFAGIAALTRFDSEQFNGLPTELCTDVLCFFLSQMGDEEQLEVLENFPNSVLSCLLEWPYQSFFLQTVNRMWDFIPPNHFDTLLRMIINKVIDGYKDFNYRELVEKVWRQSPSKHKQFITERISCAYVLNKLLQVEDYENFKLIVSDVTPKTKRKLIFSKRGKYICDKLLYSGDWELLPFFVLECIESSEDMKRFKTEIKEHLEERSSKGEIPEDPNKWEVLFCLLDVLSDGDKRKCTEEDDLSPCKETCDVEHEDTEI